VGIRRQSKGKDDMRLKEKAGSPILPPPPPPIPRGRSDFNLGNMLLLAAVSVAQIGGEEETDEMGSARRGRRHAFWICAEPGAGMRFEFSSAPVVFRRDCVRYFRFQMHAYTPD